MSSISLIAGYGPGLGEALGRRLAAAGHRVIGLCRSAQATTPDADEPGVQLLACDVTDAVQVGARLTAVRRTLGTPDNLIHMTALFGRAPFLETPPERFQDSWAAATLSAVHCAQAVLPGMVERGSGRIVFAGATASIRGGAGFSAFASAKFALRGLAQSLAREFGSQGVHVAHVLIDGVIWGARARDRFGMAPQQCLDPDQVAQVMQDLISQPANAWTHELDLRPANEKF